MRRALAAALLLAPALAAALEVPYLSGRVVDEARLLDAATAARLESALAAYEKKSGRQFVVLTLPSLEGEPLEDYSLKVARTWALGRKGKDDGLLLLVSRDDRKLRFEVGYGLEGVLPDALCGRIIRDEIVPRFKGGDFAGGVAAGVDAALKALDGEYSPPPDDDPDLPAAAEGLGGSMGEGLLERVMISFFVFGILGLFEFVGVFVPGPGWFLYFFLIPFWAAFPMAIWGAKIGLALLASHLVGFPLLKLLAPKTAWGKKLIAGMGTGGGGGGSGWSSRSSGWGGGSSGGGFSGGGGSFGGGGASGSW